MGAEFDAAWNRAGIVVAEASEVGLAPWSGQIGTILGGIRDSRSDPEASCGRRMNGNPVNEESRLISCRAILRLVERS